MKGFKVFSHDYRPPVQGGDPVWDGVSDRLTPVAVDTSSADCAPGWNFTRNPETALRIAGLWPDGRPCVLVEVEPEGEWVERGDKCRAENLRIVGLADMQAAVEALSAPFGEHREVMVESQMLWYEALGRRRRNVRNVERGLRRALKVKGLDWSLTRYPTPETAWAARADRAAWAAWDAWAARTARAAWAAREAWAAWAAWAARDAWAARAAREAWAAWDAWDARDALTIEYAALKGWTTGPSDLLTVGILDAYYNGLELVVPVETGLGWVMKEKTVNEERF